MLKLEHLAWSIPGGESIIKDIDLELGEGKLVVVTGPNGGGKTSLAKLIAGVETLSGGRIIFDGEDITDMDVTQRAKKGLAYAFQQPVRFKGLTVRDMLELAAGKELNEGELCALMGKARKAKLSIFDEPEAGIDLWSFARLVETFEELRAKSTGTLLVISHQERILSIADEIVVIADGKVRQHGPRQEILPQLLANEHAVRCPLEKESAIV